MVPGLDMVNHSSTPTAYYDMDHEDGVILLTRPGSKISSGEEVTISYGASKPAAEMLFSYGFIDTDATESEVTLPLDVLPDDPLGKAKLHAFDGPPTVKLSRTSGGMGWDSPFAYFMCLNEEDGLEFRVLQDTSGERQLRLFWQEEDVTGRAAEFLTLIEDHPLCKVFELRAVSVVLELVTTQLETIGPGITREKLNALSEAGLMRDECIQAAQKLRGVELTLLQEAAGILESQVRLVS